MEPHLIRISIPEATKILVKYFTDKYKKDVILDWMPHYLNNELSPEERGDWSSLPVVRESETFDKDICDYCKINIPQKELGKHMITYSWKTFRFCSNKCLELYVD